MAAWHATIDHPRYIVAEGPGPGALTLGDWLDEVTTRCAACKAMELNDTAA